MPAEKTFSEMVPPQNLEAEQSVLGACILDRDALLKVKAMLKPEDFYAERHGWIWEAILAAGNAGPVDLITVQDQMQLRGHLADIGGLPGLTNLINAVPTTANVEQYAEIVLRTSRLRQVQNICRHGVDEAYTADDPAMVLGNLQQRIDSLTRGTAKRGLKPVSGRIGAYADQRYANRELPNVDWIPSRFSLLREKCPYLRREVTLLAMPPNNGKTTVAVAEADFLARLGYQTAFFELEMAAEQIYDKLIAQQSRLELRAIRMGLLTGMEWQLFHGAAQMIDKMTSLSLNSETAETMANIRWQCLRMKAERGLDMVIIDFLERVSEDRLKDERYDQLLAKIAGIAQGIARDCNCHVMILAQVDVRVLDRPNPIPTLSDLANSKTNLSAWPDNIVTGIQPGRAKGDGKTKPRIWKIDCTDKRWRNTLVFSVAKGRFSEAGALIPIYAEWRTGFLGHLERPWPWQEGCPEESVGKWDKDEDGRHFDEMKEFKAKTQALETNDSWF